MAYIDKDLLLQDINSTVVFSTREGVTSAELRGANKIIDRIKQAPIADVAEAVKEFGHLLIDKAKNGVIHTMDIPDYVKEFLEGGAE